jgi:hypothetical protein
MDAKAFKLCLEIYVRRPATFAGKLPAFHLKIERDARRA